MTLDEAIKHCEEVADTPCFTDEEARCYSEHRQLAEWLKELKAYKEQSGDAVSKQAVAKILLKYAHTMEGKAFAEFLVSQINDLPSVTPQHSDAEIQKIQEMEQAEIQKAYELGKAEQPQQRSGRCKDCKYFEYDSVAKVDGIPLIVAHEICKRWGDGCKSKEDGYCFLFEPKEQEVQE